MKHITRTELDALCRNGKAIDMQSGYPCVVLHPDATITKIWAVKKPLLSSNTLVTYAQRFVNNAAKLRQRGVTVPDIIDHRRLENSHVETVRYTALPGHSIRDLLETSPHSVDIPHLCRYILSLHEKGILFRSIHFGNIILLPDGNHGLIDFTDVKYYRKPVPLKKRAANIAFPLRYSQDVQNLQNANLPNPKDTYLTLLNPTPKNQQQFNQTFTHYLKR